MKLNTPSEILSNEHKNILKFISILENKCFEQKNENKIDIDFFKNAVDFIKNYADGFHHAKEEKIYFIEICEHEASMHCNPVEQMLYEHDTGRNLVKGIIAGIEKNDKNYVIENTINYCNLLKDHIFKEDNILYPMADNILTAQVQEEMLEKFAKVEADKYKPEVIKRYLHTIEYLNSKIKL